MPVGGIATATMSEQSRRKITFEYDSGTEDEGEESAILLELRGKALDAFFEGLEEQFRQGFLQGPVGGSSGFSEAGIQTNLGDDPDYEEVKEAFEEMAEDLTDDEEEEQGGE